jgi:uncharacterized circularly permuted ATP-grasp superfamily protein/uncharacterized alpha-E superfamily protein
VIHTLAALGDEGIAATQQEAQRILRDNGVTYNVHGAADGYQRPWSLDLMPLVISEADWAATAAGVMQRSQLLNLMLLDIYGERRLLRRGLLPPELIYGHSGFLRACDGVRLAGEQQLILHAADLARGPDGRMWVLGDRTQAPSGAGYALENRTVMARLLRNAFRDGKIQRLANFFRTLQNTLAERAFHHKDAPRTVVLTPGPYNETYFEHAYLAAYLGYSLVQGDDLTVINGDVALKALSGLQPVDVILRRVDDSFCDPLELREDSWLGVAGLLESARRQCVTIVNPLGSGVLENPGLMPFMPGLARYFLGEDLLLPSAATWWCGQPKEQAHVLKNLERLVIRRIARSGASATVLGARLSKSERQALRARMQAEPHLYVGQEPVSFATAPAFVNSRCEPRHTVVRAFSVASGDSYSVMPGGLARSAPAAGELFVSNSAGGISKDIWILADEPQPYTSLWRQASQREQTLHSNQFLPSRSAENLFWVGRYAERAEFTARLLRTIFDYFGEEEVGDSFIGGTIFNETVGANSGEVACLQQLLRSLTQVTMTYPGFVDKDGEALLADPVEELLSVVLDRARIGGLHANLASMLNAAYAVRDLWSIDSWRVLNGMEAPWRALAAKPQARIPRVYDELNNLITALMAFAGLNVESMTHSASWLLLDIGRRLERAQLTVAFIRATMAIRQTENVEPLLLEMILKTTDTIITYRRRYRSQIQPSTVLDLLLLDEQNPRALGYQLATLHRHLADLPREPDPYQLSEEERLLLQAFTRLRLSNTTALAQPLTQFALRHTLDELMAELALLLSQISDVLTRTYFTHAQTPQQLLSRPVSMAI